MATGASNLPVRDLRYPSSPVIRPQHLQPLRQLLTLFLQENAQLNLSALRTPEKAWVGNVLDSLPLLTLPSLPLPRSNEQTGSETVNVLDIGTGGGFPLLPLATCLRGVQFTGLDSTGKKIQALQRIADAMELTNVQLLTGRAEDLGHDPAHRERYDIVTARAVAEIPVLLEYASGFVKPHGHVVLWKSLQSDAELAQSKAAQEAVFVHLQTPYTYNLDELAQEYPLEDGKPMVFEQPWGTRRLLLFEKGSRTPKMYPRAVGIPSKDPIRCISH